MATKANQRKEAIEAIVGKIRELAAECEASGDLTADQAEVSVQACEDVLLGMFSAPART